MPTHFADDSFDHALYQRCRREVKAAMLAASFQIGGKFDEVLTRRAHKLYGKVRRNG